jgi:hypothetical protein
MTWLTKFLRLPGSDRWLLIQSWILIAVTRLGLWVMPFRWLRAALDRWGAAGLAVGACEVPAERVAWAVRVTAQYVPWAGTCLVRSLAAHALLQRRGHTAEFRLGVTRGAEDQFHAHAWVTCAGQVLIGEREVEKFVPLDRQ